jgi:transposase
MDLPKFGKTKFGTFDDIINMMCMFSVEQQMPVYYRLLPGNIKDMTSFELCLEESGAKNAIVIIDKGFASKKNMKSLESVPLRYIIPLPGNSSMIDYQRNKTGSKSLFDSYFMYHNRYIWYCSRQIDKHKQIILFLAKKLLPNIPAGVFCAIILER